MDTRYRIGTEFGVPQLGTRQVKGTTFAIRDKLRATTTIPVDFRGRGTPAAKLWIVLENELLDRSVILFDSGPEFSVEAGNAAGQTA